MTKVKRYFDKEDSKTGEAVSKKVIKKQEQKQKKEINKIITYNIKLNTKNFGRKSEDEKLAHDAKVGKFVRRIPNPNPKYPGRAPIDEKILQKHSRGPTLNKKGIKTGIHKKRFEKKEETLKFAHEQAARVEILLTEDAGFLEADDGETSAQFTQKQIAESVDITAASKHFELQLDFGPYRAKYTRNGRHLLLAGKLGHVAAFDWVTKKLHCELNVMETVHDISWLHLETMFAVAQKDWVYIYDNQGIELHCIKRLNKVNQMEFLPYHFLLSTANDEGYLSWLDISIGQLVARFDTKLGPLKMLTHNPYNALLCIGHAKGVVSMWSPNSPQPLAKMLCHKAPMTSLHVDPKGIYLATAAVNNEAKIWDVRRLEGPLQSYKLYSSATNLNFSHQNLLAMGMGNIVEVYKDCCLNSKESKRPYLRHRFNNQIGNMSFCPFEDVLGVATERGFTSLLVPGAGEANFDALELNPYQTKSQRREQEVKALLEKIQPEMITLDPTQIAEVDVPTLRDKVDMKKKLLYLKPPKINYEPRNKAKGRGGTANLARNKKIVRSEAKKQFVKALKEVDNSAVPKKNQKAEEQNVLHRFLPKTKS